MDKFSRKQLKQLISVDGNTSELDPDKRLKQLEEYGKTIAIDDYVDIMSYFKNGLNTVNKANKQYAANDIENAFISYLKFIDLFQNKIRLHIDYESVPLSTIAVNQHHLRHSIKRVEEIRKKLRKLYTEFVVLYTKENGLRIKRETEAIVQNNDYGSMGPPTLPCMHAIDPYAFQKDICESFKTVVLPKQLATIFQVMTQVATKNNTGSWGVIVGKKENKEYVTTHLIIPEQNNPKSESKINLIQPTTAKFLDENNLMLLGWIHTHRSASCYLSVADLHVQYKYQKQLKEFVSIVCSPRYTQVEVYVLLDQGMEYIGSCQETEHHSHGAEKPLYTIAKHVKNVYDRQFDIVDLRKGKNEPTVRFCCSLPDSESVETIPE